MQEGKCEKTKETHSTRSKVLRSLVGLLHAGADTSPHCLPRVAPGRDRGVVGAWSRGKADDTN